MTNMSVSILPLDGAVHQNVEAPGLTMTSSGCSGVWCNYFQPQNHEGDDVCNSGRYASLNRRLNSDAQPLTITITIMIMINFIYEALFSTLLQSAEEIQAIKRVRSNE